MHDFGEYTANAGFHLFGRCLPSPLAQELSVLVEHHHAAVAVAIGKVHIAIFRVAGDTRRLVEPVMCGIAARPALAAVGGVKHAFGANLQQ